MRAIQRAAGTLVGTALMALVAVVTGEEWAMVACQGLAAFGLFALFARGYFWLVVLLTPAALLTISAVDYQGVGVALQRAGWSALGIRRGAGRSQSSAGGWLLTCRTPPPHERGQPARQQPEPQRGQAQHQQWQGERPPSG